MQFGPQVISNAKVLVADDSPLILTDMKRLLRDMGFSSVGVFTAKDSRSLFKRLTDEQIDLIICDYNFGDDLNGKQIYEEICHLGLIPPWCAFIMLTGEKQLETVKAIVELEPDEYIIKPYAATVVKNRILRAFARKYALRGLYNIPQDSDLDYIKEVFSQAESGHPRYSNYIKRLHGETLIHSGHYEQAKLVYKEIFTQVKAPWVMSGLLGSCILNHDYDEATRLYASWDRDNLERSAQVHEQMSRLCLIKGEVGKALLEIDRAYSKSTSMDRLYSYANLNEIHRQYKKAFQQFSSYRLASARTHRESVDNHLYIIRNLLLSTTPDQEDVQRVVSMAKQELRKIKSDAANDKKYELVSELFNIHIEYLLGHSKRFFKRLLKRRDEIESATKSTQLYYAKVALIGDQADLCHSILSALPSWDENKIDWKHLFLLAQRKVIEQDCQTARAEMEEMLNSISQTVREDSIEGIKVAYDFYSSRPECHHAAASLLSAMEFAFPKDLTSAQIRELIFDCEKILVESPVLGKADKLAGQKRSNIAKQAFNRRFANIR